MKAVPDELREAYEALVAELLDMGEFRRGSIIARERTCGKPTCACADPKHRGHPQQILTCKEKGVTRTVNLPSAATVDLARGHVREHAHFLDWSQRWQALHEKICDVRMQQVLTPATDEAAPSSPSGARKKKSRSTSRPKSHEK